MNKKKYLTPNPYNILLVIGVGALLSSMAGSMVNLALPTISRDFQTSIQDSRWVAQSFLLAASVLLPVAGRLGEILGHGKIYLAGYFLFGLCALAGGMANSLEWLIIARTLQGLGGAMIWSNGPALLTTSFPTHMRGRALGIALSTTYIGLTVGPSVGGAIVSMLGWRWTFYFFVPSTLAVLLLGFRYLPKLTKTKPRPSGSYDWLGTALLLLALPLFLVVINQGPTWGWRAFETWICLLVGLPGLVAFVLVERRVGKSSGEPLLDLSLFKNRRFSLSLVSAFANYITLFIILILLPFYLEEGLGLPPVRVGLLLSIQPLVMAVFAFPSGWLSDRLGSRYPATFGMLILATGMLGLASLGQGANVYEIALWLAIIGLGTGTFISPNSSTMMGAAPKQRQGTAGSFMAQARIMGMLVGIAIGTTIFQASGGQTGMIWSFKEFIGIKHALWIASAIAILGALTSCAQDGARGKKSSKA